MQILNLSIMKPLNRSIYITVKYGCLVSDGLISMAQRKTRLTPFLKILQEREKTVSLVSLLTCCEYFSCFSCR